MNKQPDNKKVYKRYRVQTYVSAIDKNRLKNICEQYGFRSIYQLLQYLVHCFLRVADPQNDPIDEPLPLEIEEMFADNSEWEKCKYSKGSHQGMYVHQKPDQRKIKTPDDI